MEKLCPLCNNIAESTKYCDKCGAEMVNEGRMQEFRDPYATEDEVEFIDNCCIHVYRCIKCNNLQSINIKDIYI
ncbi:hypothetical protein CPJCM30710_12890 [Clostridium polyendosporum]|uniref:Uncharacterized protein n=1 Tax=Clostridium polyendosporum TaxID=69208 RepID=A0A919VLI2_9CLOT|nr:hypothetical protein [Clostridium polyendosporum]GIM28623.1 hypothetical protein CPJCM30710_12890 [Clostridium polyendosporum]